MKTTKCLLMLSTLLIYLFGNVYSVDYVDGTNSVQCIQEHHIFHKAPTFAAGFVKFSEGFTAVDTHLTFSITEPVSGGIDLRNTSTLELLDDLYLSSNVTLSAGGLIAGHGNAIILHNDLIIPDGASLIFTDSTIIDGQGYDLVLGYTSQLVVDSHITLTLRNLTLKNTYNTIGHPAIKCLDSNGTLALDNVELALNDDFYFKNG
ncbi:hypothetical protein ACFLYH_01120, partial [Candidatus Dependentiae bacterium]